MSSLRLDRDPPPKKSFTLFRPLGGRVARTLTEDWRLAGGGIERRWTVVGRTGVGVGLGGHTLKAEFSLTEPEHEVI